MPSDTTITYLDANVLLAYINGENNRTDVVEQILTDAAQGKLVLATSTLSIVEVAYAATEAAAGTIDEQADAAIETLWAPSSPVRLVEPSVSVMGTARDLLRTAKSMNRGLKPADSIHLACAMKTPGVATILTYERDTTRKLWADLTGLDVSEPCVQEPPLPFTHQ